MNIEKIFKNLIIAQFILLVILVIYSIFAPYEDIEVTPFSGTEIALLVVLIAYYINYFLLLKFIPIGKVLFIPILLVTYTLGISTGVGPYMDDFTYMFDILSTLIDGMLIAILYFTEIKNKQETGKE